MSSWSISPSGVQSVLAVVQVSAGDLGTAAGGLETGHEELSGGVGDLLVGVANAVLGLIESETTTLTSVVNRIESCGTGAAEATIAYVAGDEEMAANAQSAAVTAAAEAPALASEQSAAGVPPVSTPGVPR